jgi:hypothetical protein
MQLDGYLAGQINMTAEGIGEVQDGQFATFCMELDEDIYNGRDYTATVNTETKGTSGSSPLLSSTAWLYNEFLDGNINITSSRSAADFQMAIWMLQDEPIEDYFSENSITQQAKNWRNKAINCGWDDVRNIRVLNLTEGSKTRQDMLVRTQNSIPEPSTAGLLGLGLILLRKKFR